MPNKPLQSKDWATAVVIVKFEKNDSIGVTIEIEKM